MFMQNMVKNIRLYVGLSQMDFAEKLGVTFATINRWENSKVSPNKLAQIRLYEFCKENAVPVWIKCSCKESRMKQNCSM